MTQELTAQALWRAVRSKRPAPGLIHHSDRGTRELSQGTGGEEGETFADRLDEAAGAGAASSFNAGDLSAHFNKTVQKKSQLGEVEGNQIPQTTKAEEPVQPDYEIVVDEEALKAGRSAHTGSRDRGRTISPETATGIVMDEEKAMVPTREHDNLPWVND